MIKQLGIRLKNFMECVTDNRTGQINTGLKVLGCCILLIAAGYHISQLTTIHVLYDEFGYSAAAAYFSGNDWSSVAGHTAYYAYGYGAVLSVLMRIAQGNMELYYQMGIGLNLIFLMGSFLISCSAGKHFFKNVPERVVILAAFFICFYSNTFTQTNILWTETILYFLFWMCTWFVMRLYETECSWYIIGWASSAAIMYMVHQRAIAVIIASIIVVVISSLIQKKGRWVIYFGLTMAVMMISNYFITNDIRNHLWGTGLSNQNDYSGQFNKIIDILTSWKGMKAFIISFIGKTYYIIVATMGLVGAAVVGMVRELGNKKSKVAYINMYLILNLLGALVINSIFMMYAERQDTLIYGRYTEHIVGPLLFFGVLYLWQHRVSVKANLIIIGVCILATGCVYIKLRNTGFVDYNMVCAIGTSQIFPGGQTAGYSPVIASVVFSLAGLSCWGFSKRVGAPTKRIIVMMMIPLSIWGYTSIRCTDVIARTSESNYNYKVVAERLNTYSQNGEVPIWYLTSETDFESRYIEILQFYLPKIDIQYINIDEQEVENKLYEGIYVYDERCMAQEEVPKGLEVIDSGMNMVILHTGFEQ